MNTKNWFIFKFTKFDVLIALSLSFLKVILNYILVTILFILFSCNGKTQNTQESIITNSGKPVNSAQNNEKEVFSGIFTSDGARHELWKNFHLSNGIYFECLDENKSKLEEKLFVKFNFKSNSNSVLVLALETSKLNNIESCFKEKFVKWINQMSLGLLKEGVVVFSSTSKVENLGLSNKFELKKWTVRDFKKNNKGPRVYK